MVETGERLDEHVYTLVSVLVSAGSKGIQSVVEIKVQVTVKVALDKLVDLVLHQGMQVLELVHGRKLDHVETVGHHTVGLSLEQVLGLVGGDVRHGGENVGRVGSRPLNAISVVDASLSGLGVHVEALQVVVEVDRAGAQVSAQQSSVCGEDGGAVDSSLLHRGRAIPDSHSWKWAMTARSVSWVVSSPRNQATK